MQARACADLGSPFMHRLMSLFAGRLAPGTEVADRLLNWPGDCSYRGDSVPLRLAGALHALKLRSIALSRVYPPNEPSDDALWSAVSAALGSHGDRILGWLDRAPQTNEVRRAAVILPVLAGLHDRLGLPVHLMELGCSGGLNLSMDEFRLDAGQGVLGNPRSAVVLSPDWRGPKPLGILPPIIGREGVDVTPIDPATEEGRLRLLAYLWPDQPERIARTDAAIDIARTHQAGIDRADAGAWLDAALPRRPKGALTVVYHTVAWQYFPPASQARAMAAIDRAARTGGEASPLARVAMEGDGGEGAVISLTTWPGGRTHRIGRADFHGRWIDWKGLPDAL